MSPVESYMLGFGLVALGFLSAALWWLVMEMQALTKRVTTQEVLLSNLIGQCVDEALKQRVRSLNEVGRS